MTSSTVARVSRPRVCNIIRFLFGILGIVLLTVIGFVAWFVVAGRGALPQVSGKINISGISAPVSVIRDPQGVPHITAKSLDDLFFAQGYVTAQDRLWQMDMARRYASGRLAEILGPKYAKIDVQQRTLLIPLIAQRAADNLDATDRQYLEAYARGVNAFMAGAANHLPVEFRMLRYTPQPWTVVDSMLVGAGMAEMLNLGTLSDGASKLLAREAIVAKLGPELAADLFPHSSFRDHPPVNGPEDVSLTEGPQSSEEEEGLPARQAEQPRRRVRRRVPRGPVSRSTRGAGRRRRSVSRVQMEILSPATGLNSDPLFPGSNNWVVSGAHTQSGKPLLSNDMHLPHQIPNTWYEIHLAAGTFNVAGLSLPGMPFVIVGHNQRIAWGFTNIGPDVTDLYVETVNQQGQYLTPVGWKEPEHRQETVQVRWGRNVNFDVTITRHGPVVSGLIPGEKRVIALKWTLQNPVGLQEPFFEVNSAQNWDEFRRAFSRFGSPGQNVVYADVDGHIGYQATGLIPIRPATQDVLTSADSESEDTSIPTALSATSVPTVQFEGRNVLGQDEANRIGLPVPGADDSHEWLGYVPFDKLPSIFDPPEGVIATANARITPSGYPYLIASEWGSAYRIERIYKLLNNGRKLVPADMLGIQTDVYSDFDRFCAQRFVYAIDHSRIASPRARQAAEILRNWDGRVTTDSPAASIVAAARQQLSSMLLEAKLGDLSESYHWFMSSVWMENMLLMQPPQWLPHDFGSFDDLLTAAVERAVNKTAPRDLSRWFWGKESRVSIGHPLFGAIPILRKLTDTGVYQQSGNGYTIKQVGAHFGPSERMTVDFSNLDGSTLNIVTGESGNVFSPHYKDQWSAWYEGRTFPLPFSAAAVQQMKSHELILEPK